MKKVGDKIKSLRRTNSSNLPSIEQGKLPPQAVDMEEAVLGALLLEKEIIDDVAKILSPECFYKQENQKIYAAIQALHDKAAPVDILTVTMALRKAGELESVGGPYYITKLTNRVVSGANADYHAKIVFQKYILRELIRLSGEIYNSAFDDTSDAFELLDKATVGFDGLTKGIIAGKDITATISLTEEAIIRYKERKAAKKENKITGMDTGLTSVNKLTGGWQKTDLIIVGARPSMGKTAFSLHCALSSNEPGLIFSLEMSKEQLIDRMMITAAEISPGKFRDGNLDEHDEGRLNAGKKILDAKRIYIDETAGITIRQIRAKARTAKRQYGIRWVIVDYLQLCHVDSTGNYRANREQDLAQISGGLKNLAKELDIPVIALSQLSRKCEERPDKRPQLSDLRESGAIEQDADVVVLLFRPEFYGMVDAKKNPIKGVGEIIFAKHRNGKLTHKEECLFNYNSSLSKLSDHDQTEKITSVAASVTEITDGIFSSDNIVEPTTHESNDDDDEGLPF